MHIAEGGLSRTQFIAAGAVAAGAAVATRRRRRAGRGHRCPDQQGCGGAAAASAARVHRNRLLRGGARQGRAERRGPELCGGGARAGAPASRLCQGRPGSERRASRRASTSATQPRTGRLRIHRGGARGPARGRLQRPGDEREPCRRSAAAATVVSVEARHAAWIRSIAGEPPAPEATDAPLSAGPGPRRSRANRAAGAERSGWSPRLHVRLRRRRRAGGSGRAGSAVSRGPAFSARALSGSAGGCSAPSAARRRTPARARTTSTSSTTRSRSSTCRPPSTPKPSAWGAAGKARRARRGRSARSSART